MPFEFAKRQFDWVEIGRVRRQEQQLRAPFFNRFAYAAAFMAGKIVHDEDIAFFQDGGEVLFDIRQKDVAVGRTVDNKWCDPARSKYSADVKTP